MPVCVIVGMGPGISLAVARRFGREGYRIAMVARKSDSLERAETALADAGLEATAFRADAGDEAELTGALRNIRERMGDPEVVVFNASAGTPGAATSLTREALLRDFSVNVVGPVVTIRECPSARTVLLTGGGLALQPAPELASLSLGKAALRSLALSLAGELAPKGVHVATVTVCGFVQEGTDFSPDRVAEEYWRLHRQSPAEWESEAVVR